MMFVLRPSAQDGDGDGAGVVRGANRTSSFWGEAAPRKSMENSRIFQENPGVSRFLVGVSMFSRYQSPGFSSVYDFWGVLFA